MRYTVILVMLFAAHLSADEAKVLMQLKPYTDTVRFKRGHAYNLSFKNKANPQREDLLALATLGRLEWLYLRDTNVTDDDMEIIATMKSLKALDLTGTSVTDRGLTFLSKLNTLKYFLAPKGVTDRAFEQIARIDSLVMLVVDISSTTETGLAPITKLERLESLSLRGRDVKVAVINHLERLPNLRSFHYDGFDATWAPELPRLKNLDSMMWQSETQTDACMVHIGKMNHLETLILGPNVTNTGLQEVWKITALRQLTVDKCSLSPGALRGVSRCSKLTTLNLSGRVGDADVAELVRVPSLRFLQLRNGFTDNVVPTLAEISNKTALIRISLIDTGISAEGLKRLRSSVARKTTVD